MKTVKKKSKVKSSTWLLGGLAVAGAYGLWMLYNSSVSAEARPHRAATDGPPPMPTPSGGMPGTGPDLNGPRVRKGVVASTHTQNLIEKKTPGMIYARITKTDKEGYRIFTPSVNGIFTRRLLAVGGKLWAEIKPQ